MASTDVPDTRQLSIPDPRPTTVSRGDDHLIRGMSCPECHHTSAVPVPWCPRCRSEMTEALFGPAGTVWSSTVVRIPLPAREPPYTLAYIDLDDGPRVLAHVASSNERLTVGQTVQLTAPTAQGDVRVVAS